MVLLEIVHDTIPVRTVVVRKKLAVWSSLPLNPMENVGGEISPAHDALAKGVETVA